MSIPEHLWRFPTADAIASLSARLNVAYDDSMQDWEWEIADPARIDEYLALYQGGELTDDERFTLMETVIQSFADLSACLHEDPRWEHVINLLDRNIELHLYSVWYWANTDSELENDGWAVTPFLRKLLSKHSGRLNAKNGG